MHWGVLTLDAAPLGVIDDDNSFDTKLILYKALCDEQKTIKNTAKSGVFKMVA